MNETGLRAAVNDKVKRILHVQSMTYASLSTNGTPDNYYDGPISDLWAEYKMLKSMPRSGIAIGAYSPQQLRWMTRRWRHGRNVIGLVGLPNRTVCVQHTPEEWLNGTTVTSAITIKETATWLINFCGLASADSEVC